MKNANKLNNKGFTLMELIIVVAIMAILIALIAPNLVGFLDKADETSLKANAKSCYTAAAAWATQARIDGITIKDGSCTVQKSTTDSTDYKGLVDVVNTANFSDKDKVEITFKDKKVTKVVWTAGNGGTATYPEGAK